MIIPMNKYVVYAILAVVVVSTGTVGVSLWIKSIENTAIEKTLAAIKEKEQEQTVDTQQNIIVQQINADVRKQSIKKASDNVKEKMAKASTNVEKQTVQQQVLDEINCYIDEFNNKKVCEISF